MNRLLMAAALIVLAAYDTHNQEPLFYEKYPGSLNDISQLQFMLDKASGCSQKNQQERRYLLDLYP